MLQKNDSGIKITQTTPYKITRFPGPEVVANEVAHMISINSAVDHKMGFTEFLRIISSLFMVILALTKVRIVYLGFYVLLLHYHPGI